MKDPVREMYDAFAADYDAMVEAEIGQPVYAEALARLAEQTRDVPGPVVDLACGSGQMLARYRAEFDPERRLIGVDLSPAMVAITAAKLSEGAEVRVGDMRSPNVAGAAGILCWFALHHLPAAEIPATLAAWHDALVPGGTLSLATWEGEGLVDYGGAAEIEAFRYREAKLRAWVEQAGFVEVDCGVEPVPEMPMSAVYLWAKRAVTEGALGARSPA
ncbi:MAG: class I SAM-dependent methyltransferase [Deltaproteobacteria bacterium]|nr:class I SAM-dependent methyltransferase [Deltaproteobacteria bacterium]